MNTSAQAYETVKPKVPSIRQRVLDTVKQAGEGGLTREELIGYTGIHQNSISGRITELKDDGLIVARGTRNNSRGNPEDVYVLGDGIPLTKAAKEQTVSRSSLIFALKQIKRRDRLASIEIAFCWGGTLEGYDFWKSIADEVNSTNA